MGCNTSSAVPTANYKLTINNQTSHYLTVKYFCLHDISNTSCIKLLNAHISDTINVKGSSIFIIQVEDVVPIEALGFTEGKYETQTLTLNEGGQNNVYKFNYYQLKNAFGIYKGEDQIDIL